MHNLRYSFFTLLFICFASDDAWSTISLRDVNQDRMPDILLFNNSTAVEGALVVIEGGNGGSSAQAIDAYLPIDDGANNVDFSTVDDAANMIFVKAETAVRIRLHYNNKSDRDHYANVAVKLEGSSDWQALTPLENNAARIVGSLSERDMTLTFSLDDLEMTSGTNHQATRQTLYRVYVFFHELIQDSNNIDPGGEDYSDGVYFDLHFSQTLPSGTPTLINLLKGDGRLTAVFSGVQGISNNTLRHKIYAFDMSTLAVGQNVQDTYMFNSRGRAGSVLSIQNVINEGSFSIRPLTNNTLYCVGLSVEDKYQFSSAIYFAGSDYPCETPEEITAFLDKEACFLFSAGLAKDHFVVSTLRDFRNKYLLANKPGRAFVAWYYQTAPKYAAMIYHSKILSILIKVLGYFLYFVINFAKSIFAVLFILLTIGLYRRWSH